MSIPARSSMGVPPPGYNTPNSCNSSAMSNFDFPKIFRGVLGGYSIPQGQMSILKHISLINKYKIVCVICTLHFHSIFAHQASKIFKESNRPSQFWCISSDKRWSIHYKQLVFYSFWDEPLFFWRGGG